MGLSIGIDVGASKVVAGVVDADGCVVERITRRRTPDSGSASLIGLLLRMIDTLRVAVPRVTAIGVGVPGLVRWPEGEIEFAANHGHRFLKLRRNLQEVCDDLSVTVENDANAAAWAEAFVGRCLGESLMFLAIGTGLGSGFVGNDGHLMRGPSGRGVEVGHIVVDRDSPERCACGRRGCLETFASGLALARSAEQLIRKDPDGVLAKRAARAENVTAAMIDAALDGDPDVVPLIDLMGRLIGRTVAESVMPVFPVDRIVVGGGLAVLERDLLDPMRSACEKTLARCKFLQAPRIRPSMCGPDAVLVGAALLAQQDPATQGVHPRMFVGRNRPEESVPV